MQKTEALAHFGGSQTKCAKAIGYTRSAVNQWPELIPEKAAARLERATNGALVYDLSLYVRGERFT
jgi:DNA-binding transcriptional regulator YdaS (Cro superfamily)